MADEKQPDKPKDTGRRTDRSGGSRRKSRDFEEGPKDPKPPATPTRPNPVNPEWGKKDWTQEKDKKKK